MKAGNEPLPDDETGIAIGVALHGAVFTEHEGCAWGIAFQRLARIVANDGVVAAVAFPACIPGGDPTGDDLLVPRLIFGIGEDASLHPESPFAIPASAILALFGLEVAQMLKDENGCPLLLGKLDYAGAHQVGNLLVHLLDLAPEGGIVLFACSDDARLDSVACNASKLVRAFSRISLCHAR